MSQCEWAKDWLTIQEQGNMITYNNSDSPFQKMHQVTNAISKKLYK